MWPPIWPQGTAKECSTACPTLARTLVATQQLGPNQHTLKSQKEAAPIQWCFQGGTCGTSPGDLERSVAVRTDPMTWMSCSATWGFLQ